MTGTSYAFKKLKFNDYEAYFLNITTPNFIFGKTDRFIPAMAHYINDKKNTCISIGKFPTKIKSTNFFYFIHSQDKNQLDQFIRENPDINMYLDKLKEYLKSNK